jgi:hypothetical protein
MDDPLLRWVNQDVILDTGVPRHAFPWERDGSNGALIRGDWQVGHGEICHKIALALRG